MPDGNFSLGCIVTSSTGLFTGAAQKTDSQRIREFVNALSTEEIRRLLEPVREGLVTQSTQLHLLLDRSTNECVECTVEDLLHEINPSWGRWILSSDTRGLSSKDRAALDLEQGVSGVRAFVASLRPSSRRHLLLAAAHGFLNDDSRIQARINDDNRQISLSEVVSALTHEENEHYNDKRFTFARIVAAVHYSSFDCSGRTDMSFARMPATRSTLSMWWTFLFSLSTIIILATHIWAQITNFHTLEQIIEFGPATATLVISSLFVGFLLYTTVYIAAFLWHCDSSLGRRGGLCAAEGRSCGYQQFGVLHFYPYRIALTNLVLLIHFGFNMAFFAWAHDNSLTTLSVYPSLVGVTAAAIGLLAMQRISLFLQRCATANGEGRILLSKHCDKNVF